MGWGNLSPNPDLMCYWWRWDFPKTDQFLPRPATAVTVLGQ